MKSRLASVRAASGLDRADRAVQLLEDEWQRHGEVRLENFWTQRQSTEQLDAAESLGTLAALVKADLRRRFDLGETPAVADYLGRFPELRTADSRVLSLVYEEFCLHEERGTAPDVESFCSRYPEWKNSLASQLRYHRLISQAAGGTPSLPRFPQPGEDFEEFHLLSLLGKGGTSRVFLAQDRSLGGKQVALKVTLDRGQEPNVQGPLDHPHIVPVNSVSYQKEGRLCGLSMPFQPGLPLDEIIKRVEPAKQPTDAMAFWRALTSGASVPARAKQEPGASRPPEPRGDGWEQFPIRGTFSQGAAWIVMMVARALDYAHGKHIYHRDVKPANVLMTITHGPQLLDFNLAESPHSSDRAQAALHGGTLPYMAPEQIEAFLNPELWGKVGARADIYSLGLVLRELLTGQMPEAPEEHLPPARAIRDLLDRKSRLDTTVRRFNRGIPYSLEAIVAKCLALSPDDRYPDAGTLARDLDRFLKRQPLLAAPNASRRERVGNWLVRQRKLFAAVAFTFGLAGILYCAVFVGPNKQRSLATVKSLPLFAHALDLLEKGDAGHAADLFSELAKSHPQSCLPKLYLAFSLKEHPPGRTELECESESENALREAFAVPQAGEELTDWARLHPEITQGLIELIDAAMSNADRFAELYDAEELATDAERDTRLRKSAYELARKSLPLAERLDPSAPKLQRLIARTEELFGEFPQAHDRLSRLIDSSSASRSESRLDTTELFFCLRLRGRVAFRWVEQHRLEKLELEKDALNLLDGAIKDLNLCLKVMLDHPISEDPARKEYRILHDKARATLTMAEVENDRGLSPEKDLKKSGVLIDQLKDRASQIGERPPAALQKRFDDDMRRFGPGHSVATSHSRQSTGGKPAKTGTHSG